MWKNLGDMFQGETSLEVDSNGHPVSPHIRVATVGILVHAARMDGGLRLSEIRGILGALFAEFGLSDYEGSELLELAEFLLRDPEKLDEFIGLINSHFDASQRGKILGLVWKVIVADGNAEYTESLFAADLRKSLNLTMEQALRAQQLSQQPAPPMPKVANAEHEE